MHYVWFSFNSKVHTRMFDINISRFLSFCMQHATTDAEDDRDAGEMDAIAKQPDGTEDAGHRGRLSDVRLARGHTLTPNEGFVQVLYSNQWQFVCSRYWSLKLSNMTCHSLGYTTALLPSDGQIAYRANAVAEEVPGILRLVCPRNTRNLTECDVRPITIDTRFMCEDNGIAMVTCQKKDEGMPVVFPVHF